MIGLSEYAKIKNNYAVCYFGLCDEYLLQLQLARPYLEKRFPGLNIYIGCKDESCDILKNCDNVLKLSELKIRKPEFAHIHELRCDGLSHPVEEFLKRSGLTHYPAHAPFQEKNTFKIVRESFFPTKPLTEKQVDFLKKFSREKGWRHDESVSGIVLGVESLPLIEAAAQGLPTFLVPTGVGTRLYKNMFPFGKIVEA